MTPSAPSLLPDIAADFAWLVRARWIAAAALGAFALLTHYQNFAGTLWPLLSVVAASLVYNGVFARLAIFRNRPRSTALTSLCFDLIALTIFLHFSGDMENPLRFAYALPIVAGAILLSLRSALGLATLAALLFGALIYGTYVDSSPIHLPHHHLALLRNVSLHEWFDPNISGEGWDYIVWNLIALVAILFGTAVGSGTLSSRIRRHRREILADNERMKLLLSILPDGVVLIGKNGDVVVDNDTARKLYPALAGGTIQGLGPELRIGDRLGDVSGEPLRFESRLGDRILEHAIAGAAPGGPFVWIFREITQQRLLTAQVIHQAKMVDLGLLAAGIAHEIGNPLSSMAAVIEVLEMKGLPPEFVERLRSLRTHVDRIDRIVKDVTGFARPSGDRATTVDASALAVKALQIFLLHERSRGITIDAPLPEAAALVRAVEDQVVQVLLNFLLNAADASDGHGELRITTRRTDREAEISVTDHGTGISEEDQHRLFTAFFTTKDPGKGVGLGLFVSESIARLNGGRIRVESSLGKGSTFTLCLPLASDA